MKFALTPQGRHACVTLLACLAVIAATPAQAMTLSLGTIASPEELTISNGGLSGDFSDSYLFSIASGDSFSFSASLQTSPSNRFWIDDLDGALIGNGSPVAYGDSQPRANPFPWTYVAFPTVTLGAGDYALNVFGNATSAFPGPTSSYMGTLGFAQVTPVPEPATVLLMLTGLAGLGAHAARRRRSRD